jgi:hypothetical protein
MAQFNGITSMVGSYIASPQGQELVRNYLSSPEGQAAINAYLATPGGQQMARLLLSRALDSLDISADVKEQIRAALDAKN